MSITIWATVAVSIDEIGKVKVEDRESFELYDLEAEAHEAVEEGLRSGDKAVALFKLDGVYEIDAITLRKTP